MGSDPTLNLDANGLPQSPWPIYTVQEPNVPDNCITLKDTQGHEFGRAQIDGEMFYHPGFQVRVRSHDWTVGWLKADAIRVFLAQTWYQGIVTPDDGTGKTYMVFNFNNISQVLPLGKDTPTSKRNLFTINVCIVLRQLT
jgi:hypothetical protein